MSSLWSRLNMKSHLFKFLFVWTFLCCASASHAIEGRATHAQVYSLITQTPVSGTGTLVRMETVQSIQNMELSPSKELLIIKEAGTYQVFITTPIGATAPGAKGYVDFWAVRNGKPMPNTNNRQSVFQSNFVETIRSGFIASFSPEDTLGIMLSASGPSLGLIYLKPHGEPAIPSMNLAIIKL